MNRYHNLIIEESEDNIDNENLNDLFTLSVSSKSSKKNIKKKSNNVSIDVNQNKLLQNATTGMDVIDNDVPNFIDEDDQKKESLADSIETCSSDSSSDSSNNSNPINQKKDSISGIVENMLKKDNKNINGWDNEANITITNWYKTFKQQSFIYQFVLDRNRKISDKLAVISIISSTLLGIFSGFKLWIDNNAVFQTVSNILLMLLNFVTAFIIASSKRYIDDKRNETIRTYVEDIDMFIGELSAQVLNSPVYRMNADKFFKQHNNKYTRLISLAPNLSIDEINKGKEYFALYKEHCYYNV